MLLCGGTQTALFLEIKMNFIFHWLDSLVSNDIPCSVLCWNELPAQELKLISSKNALNKVLKEHLLNNLDENFVCE
jgi:hypothetical protein